MLVTVVALMALFAPAAVTGGPGLEFLQPAAVVLIAGLLTSLPVTLFVLPGLAVASTRTPRAPAPDTPDGRERRLATAGTSAAGNPGSSPEGS